MVTVGAFNANGTLRSDFGSAGFVSYDFGQSMTTLAGIVRQSSGKLIVAGTLANASGQTSFVTARLLANGSLDTSFAGVGWRTNAPDTVRHINIASALALQPDGMILVGGTAGNAFVGGDQIWALVRLTTDGQPDPSFGAAGVMTDDFSPINREQIDAILPQADGRIVVAGGADTDRLHVGRYLPTGARDPSFGTGGIVTDYFVGPARAIAPSGSGYQVAGTGVWPAMKKGYLLRLNADGSVDGGPNTRTLDQVFDMALYANGKIAVAGAMGDRFAVGVHNPDGSWDMGFGDGGIARLDGLDSGSAASRWR